MRITLASVLSVLIVSASSASAAAHGAHPVKRHHDVNLAKREVKLESLPNEADAVAKNVTGLSKRDFSNARFSFYDVGLYASFLPLSFRFYFY